MAGNPQQRKPITAAPLKLNNDKHNDNIGTSCFLVLRGKSKDTTSTLNQLLNSYNNERNDLTKNTA